MNTSTRDTPVRYGRAYLDDAQWARQEQALHDAPKSIYGPGYLDAVAPQTPTAPTATTEPAQYSLAQLKDMLSASGTVESYTLALKAEAFRAAGARKSAVTLLAAAAKRLERPATELATIEEMLADPDATVNE